MKCLWLSKCNLEAGYGLRFYYVVTEVVPIFSSSIEERVFELLSVAGLDLKALVVVWHIILNWILCKKSLLRVDRICLPVFCCSCQFMSLFP